MKQIEHNGITLKIGDAVTIHRKVVERTGGMGPLGDWDNIWVPPMDGEVGKQYRIEHIGPTGVRMRGMSPSYAFPLLSVLPDYPKLLPAPVSKAPYALKPLQRVVTRNGWQFIVVSHDMLTEGTSPAAPLYLMRENDQYAYINWPGEANPGYEMWEVVEVYDPPPYISEILALRKRGELRWHEGYDAQQAEKAKTLKALQQQRVELDARINELGG